MQPRPLRASVVGSYPAPGWLEHAGLHLNDFGQADLIELQEDAVSCVIQDQLAAGLDVITDGEQARLDFNLSFYGRLDGLEFNVESLRRWGPPAHDQRGKYNVTREISAPTGLGVIQEFERLKRLAPPGLPLKASVPGPYTMAGRLIENKRYKDRFALTEALVPIVQKELQDLLTAGCKEITIDEPSMSCYAHRENITRLVEIFNRTAQPIVGRCRLGTDLCFGNYKGRAVGPRSYQIGRA